MKVYKFGGASVRNADGVRNLRQIIDEEQHLFIIVSAMGKTTNALEKVFEGLQKGDKQQSLDHIGQLREYHAEIIDDLWHEPKRLEKVASAASSSERERQRARVILLRADGKTYADIEAEVGVSTPTIAKILKNSVFRDAVKISARYLVS